jgi:acyl-CoA thioester hydrolase
MNNAKYIELFDTAINSCMISRGVLDVFSKTDPVGFCVESKCTYHSPVAYPSVLNVGIRVGSLGNSSVRWECGVFDACKTTGCAIKSAEGHFVHVFVDPATHTKVKIDGELRQLMEGLLHDELYEARMDKFGVAPKWEVLQAAKRPGVVWLDVRSNDELSESQLDVAYEWIPVTMDDISHVVQDFSTVLPDKQRPIIAFCGVGGRVMKVKEFLQAQGYNVINGGGLDDIRDVANKTTTAKQ